MFGSPQQSVIDAALTSGESDCEHACTKMDNILNNY